MNGASLNGCRDKTGSDSGQMSAERPQFVAHILIGYLSPGRFAVQLIIGGRSQTASNSSGGSPWGDSALAQLSVVIVVWRH
jgi:hypothetical protein